VGVQLRNEDDWMCTSASAHHLSGAVNRSLQKLRSDVCRTICSPAVRQDFPRVCSIRAAPNTPESGWIGSLWWMDALPHRIGERGLPSQGARVCTQLVDEITKPDSVMALAALQRDGKKARDGWLSPCKLHLMRVIDGEPWRSRRPRFLDACLRWTDASERQRSVLGMAWSPGRGSFGNFLFSPSPTRENFLKTPGRGCPLRGGCFCECDVGLDCGSLVGEFTPAVLPQELKTRQLLPFPGRAPDLGWRFPNPLTRGPI